MSPTPRQIVAGLKDYRITVIEDKGWTTRGAKTSNGVLRPFHPYAQAVHHDAMSEAVSDATALRVMRDGRIDLAGPLCNGWIDSSGVVYLISANNANHAGWNERDVHDRLSKGLQPMGDARNDPDTDGIVGNSFLWGWECRNAGDGHDPWEQLDVMERACAAIADVYGWSSNAIAGHRELTARKTDPVGFDMFQFRRDVKKIQADHNAPPPLEFYDDMATKISRLDNNTDEIIFLGGKLFQAKGNTIVTTGVEEIAVTGDRWNAILHEFGPVIAKSP